MISMEFLRKKGQLNSSQTVSERGTFDMDVRRVDGTHAERQGSTSLGVKSCGSTTYGEHLLVNGYPFVLRTMHNPKTGREEIRLEENR